MSELIKKLENLNENDIYITNFYKIHFISLSHDLIIVIFTYFEVPELL